MRIHIYLTLLLVPAHGLKVDSGLGMPSALNADGIPITNAAGLCSTDPRTVDSAFGARECFDTKNTCFYGWCDSIPMVNSCTSSYDCNQGSPSKDMMCAEVPKKHIRINSGGNPQALSPAAMKVMIEQGKHKASFFDQSLKVNTGTSQSDVGGEQAADAVYSTDANRGGIPNLPGDNPFQGVYDGNGGHDFGDNTTFYRYQTGHCYGGKPKTGASMWPQSALAANGEPAICNPRTGHMCMCVPSQFCMFNRDQGYCTLPQDCNKDEACEFQADGMMFGYEATKHCMPPEMQEYCGVGNSGEGWKSKFAPYTYTEWHEQTQAYRTRTFALHTRPVQSSVINVVEGDNFADVNEYGLNVRPAEVWMGTNPLSVFAGLPPVALNNSYAGNKGQAAIDDETKRGCKCVKRSTCSGASWVYYSKYADESCKDLDENDPMTDPSHVSRCKAFKQVEDAIGKFVAKFPAVVQPAVKTVTETTVNLIIVAAVAIRGEDSRLSIVQTITNTLDLFISFSFIQMPEVSFAEPASQESLLETQAVKDEQLAEEPQQAPEIPEDPEQRLYWLLSQQAREKQAGNVLAPDQ